MQGFYLSMHPQNSLQRKGNGTRRRASTLLQFILSTVAKKKGRKEKGSRAKSGWRGGAVECRTKRNMGKSFPGEQTLFAQTYIREG